MRPPQWLSCRRQLGTLSWTPAFASVLSASNCLFGGTDTPKKTGRIALTCLQPCFDRYFFWKAFWGLKSFYGEVNINRVPVNSPTVRGHITKFSNIAVFEPRKIRKTQEKLPAIYNHRNTL